jgi:hypothetical protein
VLEASIPLLLLPGLPIKDALISAGAFEGTMCDARDAMSSLDRIGSGGSWSLMPLSGWLQMKA